jgi:hypothetical protein
VTRQAVVNAAVAELGPDTHAKRLRYWESALGHETTYESIASLAWCGGFALYCLHQAGLAKDVVWHVGSGFLLQPPHPLPRIKVPEPGDIGYQDKPFQHHFVVTEVDGALVHSVDGNQPDVRRKTRSLSPSLTFFSIAPLLKLASELPSPSGAPPKHWTQPAEVQHAVNGLIMRHLSDSPPTLLTVDGIIGPKSVAALQWAQRVLGIPITGAPDSATCHALGLS